MKQFESENHCAMCGGEKRPGKTMFSADLGFGVVMIRDVPAMVCAQCGADWLSDDTAERIEHLVETAREQHEQVNVLPYS